MKKSITILILVCCLLIIYINPVLSENIKKTTYKTNLSDPDLELTNIIFDGPNISVPWYMEPPEYATAHFTIEITNTGSDVDINNQRVKVELYFDEENEPFDTLEFGSDYSTWTWKENRERSKIAHFDKWPVETELHTVTIKIDSDDIVDEGSGEDNNIETREYKAEVKSKSYLKSFNNLPRFQILFNLFSKYFLNKY